MPAFMQQRITDWAGRITRSDMHNLVMSKHHQRNALGYLLINLLELDCQERISLLCGNGRLVQHALQVITQFLICRITLGDKHTEEGCVEL
jgi:hypothetical protein